MRKTAQSSQVDQEQPALAPTEEELTARLDPDRIPAHVGIIMDGNGRWARQHGFVERIRGHEEGVKSVRAAVRIAGEVGVSALTLYAFSKENWNRPRREIKALMIFLERFLYQELDELNDNNVRLIASGDLGDLPAGATAALEHTRGATANNTGLVLNLALSYGGRSEIIHAVKRVVQEVQAGQLELDQLDEEAFGSYLYRPELGDPDLIIRTSGEYRISNFLIWQAAYSELYITPVLWPDFGCRRHNHPCVD